MRILMLTALTLVASGATPGVHKPSPCHDNSFCRNGYICDLETNLCSKCINCKDLNRKSNSSCGLSIRACGQCLQGFVEDQNRDLNCVQKAVEVPDENPSDTNNDVFWVLAGLFIVAVFLVAGFFFCKYISKLNLGRFNVGTDVRATLPTYASAPPPPYNDDAIKLTDIEKSLPSEEDLNLVHRYQPRQPTYMSQPIQTAGPFSPPSYVRLPARAGDENMNELPVNEDREPTRRPNDLPVTQQEPNNNNNNIHPQARFEAPSALPMAVSNPLIEEAGDSDSSAALVAAQNTNVSNGIASPPVLIQTLSRRDEENYDNSQNNSDTGNVNIQLNINVLNQMSQKTTINK